MSYVTFEAAPGFEFLQVENLPRDAERQVHQAFDSLLGKHFGDVVSLELLPFDPDTYPEQRLDIVGMRGELADIDTVRSIARSAYKHFDDIEAQFRAREDVLNNAYIDLAAGQDLILLFDHGSIPNAPLGGVGFDIAETNFATEELHRKPAHAGFDLFASKLITRMSALGLPASRILTMVSRLRFSIPPSATIRGTNIPNDVRYSFNEQMQAASDEARQADSPSINEEIQPGGVTVIAGSGSRDIAKKSGLIGKRHTTVHMGPLAHGTVELLKKGRVLPIGLVITEKEPIVSIGRVHNPIKKASEAVGLMGQIAAMNSFATGDEYIYHPTRENFEAATK